MGNLTWFFTLVHIWHGISCLILCPTGKTGLENLEHYLVSEEKVIPYLYHPMIYTFQSAFTLSKEYLLLGPQIPLVWTELSMKAFWGPNMLLDLARCWV